MSKKTLQDKLEALQAALERKKEEYSVLCHGCHGHDDLDKKEKLKKEMTEIGKEIGKLALLAQAEEFAEEARGYISLAKSLVDSNKKEAAEAIRVLLGLFVDIRNDLEPELAKFSKIRAEADFRDFTNLTKAGFTEHYAFQILLARIKPAAHVSSALQGASAAEKMAGAAEKVKSTRG